MCPEKEGRTPVLVPNSFLVPASSPPYSSAILPILGSMRYTYIFQQILFLPWPNLRGFLWICNYGEINFTFIEDFAHNFLYLI